MGALKPTCFKCDEVGTCQWITVAVGVEDDDEICLEENIMPAAVIMDKASVDRLLLNQTQIY